MGRRDHRIPNITIETHLKALHFLPNLHIVMILVKAYGSKIVYLPRNKTLARTGLRDIGGANKISLVSERVHGTRSGLLQKPIYSSIW